jgi:membrane protein DedA with SNARE-associated domain
MFEALSSSTSALVALSVSHSHLFIYLSVLAVGESAIFLCSLFVVDGTLSFYSVLLFSYAAVLTADVFWFIVGRYTPLDVLPDRFRQRSTSFIRKILTFVFGDRVFLPILFLKFFYGTRILSILYFARTPLPFVRFFIYDALGSLVYVLLIMLLGIASKTTLSAFFPNMSVEVLLCAGVLICLVIFLLLKTISSLVHKN